MKDVIAELVKLLPPPETPDGTAGDWDEVERGIGTRLPSDFKQFIAVYGNVTLFKWIRLFAPFPFEISRWQKYLSKCTKLVERFHDADEEPIPFPMFPTPGGLLPAGMTDNGEAVYWITSGDPDQWGVYLLDPRGFIGYSMPDKSITEVLLEFAKLTSPLFPYTAPLEFCAERSVVVRHVA